MFGFEVFSCLPKHHVYELVFPVMLGEDLDRLVLASVHMFLKSISSTVMLLWACEKENFELISLYPLSVMTGAFEEGEE